MEKVADGATGRFIVCPASGYLHPPVAVEVYASSAKRKPTTWCDCYTRVWLPSRRWSEGMGLTLEDVRAKGLALGQRELIENVPAGEGKRFVVCPSSFFLHPGAHAVLVERTAKRKIPYTSCTCGTNCFFGTPQKSSRWTDGMGMTAADAKEQQLTITG